MLLLLYGPPPSANACEVVLDAADVEERVNVVEPCPSLGLLVAHWVSHFVLLPAQPSQRVVPARLTLKQILESAILKAPTVGCCCALLRCAHRSKRPCTQWALGYVKR
jgi:hypothetical protein